jgi:hypothetical protein
MKFIFKKFTFITQSIFELLNESAIDFVNGNLFCAGIS